MQESREAIERILKTLDNNGRLRMPAELEVKGKDLVKILRERYGLGEHHALRVAQILAE